jgi:hypothetical protein
VRKSRLERAEEACTHWRAQATQVERERAAMVWVLRVGVPAGVIVAAFIQIWIGVGVVAMTALTYGLGVYMTWVRRAEFAQHVRDADAELVAARAASADGS